ncbi:MAG: GYDIA family GHMP kinase [Saprospiraceae bacterium]|nr:GYDIA family GHMP kinase [Saprospiraceae bacterium]
MTLPFLTHPHGKLLLTAEYAVLDGALALALPTRFGQSLAVVEGGASGELRWQSLDHTGRPWFEGVFVLPHLALKHSSEERTGRALEQVLQTAKSLGTDPLPGMGLALTARLDFPRDWGLGSSSTLIAAVARWFGVDPFQLLADTFGGSGYDVACAYAPGPILYQISGEQAVITPAAFDPPFRDNLFLVHLGQKQDSRAGIRYYREQLTDTSALVRDLSEITEAILECADQETFEALLLEHEHRLAEALNLPRAQRLYFEGFPGVVKSLGAWGGDFVLATSPWPEGETRAWFQARGFASVLGWRDMFFS